MHILTHSIVICIREHALDAGSFARIGTSTHAIRRSEILLTHFCRPNVDDYRMWIPGR